VEIFFPFANSFIDLISSNVKLLIIYEQTRSMHFIEFKGHEVIN